MDEIDGPRAFVDLNINDLKLVVNGDLEVMITDHACRRHFMSLHIFWELLQRLDQIGTDLDSILYGQEVHSKIALGDNHFVTLSSPYQRVKIGQWNRQEPTSHVLRYHGISLNIYEWRALVSAIWSLNIPELDNFIPCYLHESPNECDVCFP